MQLAVKDSGSAFQSRRRETWRIIRPWVTVTAAGFLFLFGVFEFPDLFEEPWRRDLVFGAGFLVLLISVGRISLTLNKLYRCPACGSMPMAKGHDGVLLDPDTCPDCGATLK